MGLVGGCQLPRIWVSTMGNPPIQPTQSDDQPGTTTAGSRSGHRYRPPLRATSAGCGSHLGHRAPWLWLSSCTCWNWILSAVGWVSFLPPADSYGEFLEGCGRLREKLRFPNFRAVEAQLEVWMGFRGLKIPSVFFLVWFLCGRPELVLSFSGAWGFS